MSEGPRRRSGARRPLAPYAACVSNAAQLRVAVPPPTLHLPRKSLGELGKEIEAAGVLGGPSEGGDAPLWGGIAELRARTRQLRLRTLASLEKEELEPCAAESTLTRGELCRATSASPPEQQRLLSSRRSSAEPLVPDPDAPPLPAPPALDVLPPAPSPKPSPPQRRRPAPRLKPLGDQAAKGEETAEELLRSLEWCSVQKAVSMPSSGSSSICSSEEFSSRVSTGASTAASSGQESADPTLSGSCCRQTGAPKAAPRPPSTPRKQRQPVAARIAALRAKGKVVAPLGPGELLEVAGQKVVFEDTIAISGLGFPGEEGTLLISTAPDGADGVALDVFRKIARGAQKVAHRVLTNEELCAIFEWGGVPHKQGGDPAAAAASTRYAWLSGLVEIQRPPAECTWECDATLLRLKGYDVWKEEQGRKEPTPIEYLQTELRGMLESHRAKICQRTLEVDSFTAASDPNRPRKALSEVLEAAAKLGIREDTADALHEYFHLVDTSGDGFLDENEFRACVRSICLAGDRVGIEDPEIRQQWRELRSQAPYQKVGFQRFVKWLVVKFPHVSDMSAWQIRRFAGIKGGSLSGPPPSGGESSSSSDSDGTSQWRHLTPTPTSTATDHPAAQIDVSTSS